MRRSIGLRSVRGTLRFPLTPSPVEMSCIYAVIYGKFMGIHGEIHRKLSECIMEIHDEIATIHEEPVTP